MIDSKLQLLRRLVGGLALLAVGSAALAGGPPPDTDGDGVDDFNDNCLLVPNLAQRDTDSDGFGNFCDGDFDNNGIVNLADLAAMKLAFFSSGADLEEDLNGDGTVNFPDLFIMKAGFFLPPGPGAIGAAPTDIALDNNSVDENQPAGTPVGTFTTTDPNAADTHTYTLVGGAGSTDNAEFAIIGDVLQTAAVLNYEAADNCMTSATTCSIRVQTDDGNGGMFSESFIINITDANDAPTDIALDNNDVDENQPVGTPVGNFSTTDEDTADTHTYTLVAGAGDTDNVKFQIVGSQLQTNVVFDFEGAGNCATSMSRGTGSTCSVRVQTDDGNGGSFEESLIIGINNLFPTVTIDSPPADSPVVNFVLVGFTGANPAGNSLTYDFSYSTDGGTTFLPATDFGGGTVFGNPTIIPAPVGAQSWEWDTSADIRTDEFGVIFQVGVTDSVTGESGSNQISWDVPNQATCTINTPAAGSSLTGDTLIGFTLVQPSPNGLNVSFEYSVDGGTTFQPATDAGGGTVTGNPTPGIGPGPKTWEWAAPSDIMSLTMGAIFRLTISDSVFGPPGNSTCMTTYDIDPGVVNTPPVANQDDYTTGIGNTRLQLVVAPTGPSAIPTVQIVGTVISNDTDADAGDLLSATPNAAIATSQGGTVELDADGRFIYTPAVTFPNAVADSFTYEVCDDGTPSECANGTVNITGSNIVWYVDISSPNDPGTGTAVDPFRNLASAAGPSQPGHTIFVHSGSQTTGITLQDNESLIGQGVPLVIGSTTLVTAGTRPVITTSGTAITLASDNTVSGLDVNVTGAGQGIVGSALGTSAAINNASITTNTGTGLNLSNGNAIVSLDSVTSTGVGANPGIVLSNTGVDQIAVNGGTISNKSVDAITLDNTGGPVAFNNMIIQDIGDASDATDGLDTRSGQDGIHGKDVNGGLTLDGTTIRRISDNCVNGATFTVPPTTGAATVWNGLVLNDALIENCNRYHVDDKGDSQEESGIRIDGITGTVLVENSTLQFAANGLDFFVSSGMIDMTVQNSIFNRTIKEFPTGSPVNTGQQGIRVFFEGAAGGVIRIGDPAQTNAALGNTFTDNALGSIQIAHFDESSVGDVDVVISQNTFQILDHLTSQGAPGNFSFNFPNGGVLLNPGAGTFDAIVSNNLFDQVLNANGGTGQLTIIADDGGSSQIIVQGNEFKFPWNGPVRVVADGNSSMAVKFGGTNAGEPNTYTDGFLGGGGTDLGACSPGFQTPYLPWDLNVRNGGALDLTIQNEVLAQHDDGSSVCNPGDSFPGPESFKAVINPTGGTLDLSITGTASPDGYNLTRNGGTFNLYATGGCGGAPSAQAVLQANGDTGGGGSLNPFTNGDATTPPTVATTGTITCSTTAPTLPSITIP